MDDAFRQEYEPVRRKRPKHPTGMEPGLDFNPDSGNGEAVIALDHEPVQEDWDKFVVDAGFPQLKGARYKITQARAWQMPDGEGGVQWLHYFRAIIDNEQFDVVDFNALKASIKRRKPTKRVTGNQAFVLLLSDWQIGKGEGGGSAATIERVKAVIANSKERIKQLRKAGHKIGKLALCFNGDLVEGCSGFYAMQTYQVDLDRRQQGTVVRRLIALCITELAPLFDEVVIAVAPGNHGENRIDGKSYTTFGDNDDVAIPEQVKDIFDTNPNAYGHVKWVIPRDHLTITVDVAGTVLGLAHGHQFKGSGSLAQKVERWWSGQMKSRWDVGDADILLTAHYHHFALARIGRRWWIQNSTLDGGSAWFEETHGGTSGGEGSVSFLLSPDNVGEFDEIKLITP